nr:reverse transcriptase domain-containing protein [Tanacetum cinerariifolium]
VKALGNYRGRKALYKRMDGFNDSEVAITIQRIVTIRSTILIPAECTTIAATPKVHAKKAEARHENFKVAIHPDFPDQEITIGGTIEELVRTGKLSHFIKEIMRDRDQQKTGKKDASVKDKAAAIYMIQPWQIVTRQKVTQSFVHVKEITYPPLTANKGTGGPLVIEAKISGHVVHRIYMDGGSSMEVLYEHCFNRLRSEIKSQMVLATTLAELVFASFLYRGYHGRW